MSYIAQRKMRPLLDRFMSFVNVPEPNGCWLWIGAKRRKGYGTFGIQIAKGKQRLVAAHRFAYEHFRGPIAPGLQLDHLCRNHACVRPDHLEAVTCRENLLRGDGFNKVNALKTHCPQGHPYDETNTRRIGGHRQCRTCTVERTRRWKAARRVQG